MDIEALRADLSYDPETGDFTWISRRPGIKYGKKAGCLNGSKSRKYLQITVAGTPIPAHRLAWLFYYGEYPAKIIDHINGDPLDNRISNLRLTTDRMNALNKECHRLGILPGTRFNKRDNVWEARMMINGSKFHLGSYKTKEEASARYMEAVEVKNRIDEEVMVKFMEWLNPRPTGRPRKNPQL